jgi:hypothetical protein
MLGARSRVGLQGQFLGAAFSNGGGAIGPTCGTRFGCIKPPAAQNDRFDVIGRYNRRWVWTTLGRFGHILLCPNPASDTVIYVPRDTLMGPIATEIVGVCWLI